MIKYDNAFARHRDKTEMKRLREEIETIVGLVVLVLVVVVITAPLSSLLSLHRCVSIFDIGKQNPITDITRPIVPTSRKGP
jgi:hypothetical protein